MGIYTLGPHRDATLELASIANASVFVESGTYKGKTTRWAASHFEQVHTIERAEPFYNRYSAELEQLGNITTYFSDSRKALPNILQTINEQPAVFWLDGHWSGGVTAGKQDECPILEELKQICDRNNDIIMIDDARLFLSAPPIGFDADQWPSVFELASALGADRDKYFVEIFHDIIFMCPRDPLLIKCLRKWSRKHAESLGRSATG